MTRPWIAGDLLCAKRGGMTLWRGIDAEIMARLPPLARARVRRIAVGRAVLAERAKRHNAAAAWLRIGARA